PNTGQPVTNTADVTIETFENTTARGERQLAGQLIDPDTQMPFVNEAAGTNNGFYSEFNAINYEGCGDSSYNNLQSEFASVFDYLVATNGIYRLRLLQEQRDGRASLEWYWVNPTTGARELVRPLVLESAANANGPYAMDATALINPDAKTVVVPMSGNARFYR